MTTKIPRVSLTLPGDVKASYERYAAVKGVSLSKAIADILQDARPSVDGLTEIMENLDNPALAVSKLERLARDASNGLQSDIFDQAAEIKPQK